MFTTITADPAAYPDEAAYLPAVIGIFTSAVKSLVRTIQPTCRFEVLYPIDVNQTSFNQAINYPQTAWTPSALACLKTEGIGFTLARDLDESETAIDFGQPLGFPATQRSHLVSIGDSTTAWLKEARIAQGKGFESVVLFALDQFCLIGYEVPLPESQRRSVRVGNRGRREDKACCRYRTFRRSTVCTGGRLTGCWISFLFPSVIPPLSSGRCAM